MTLRCTRSTLRRMTLLINQPNVHDLSRSPGTWGQAEVVRRLAIDADTGPALVGGLSRRPGCMVVAMRTRVVLREVAVAAGAATFLSKDDDIDAFVSVARPAHAARFGHLPDRQRPAEIGQA